MNELTQWEEYEEGRGPKPDSATSLGRHERKCSVCNHPDRDAIEQEFLRWYAPEDIARDHDIPHASSIYRHAHATGLFERRSRTIRLALEPLIEQATGVEATADSVIRAIRTYAHLNGAGEWVNPPSHVVYHVVPVGTEAHAMTTPRNSPAKISSTEIQISNRKIQELEGVPKR
ncbi:MAG TPA: hypothetical protein VJO53_02610 [Candidatus Acidoferrales bacterium]|nr:hypothetical protein [Candidatus Acidoferrales bacterium]